MPKDSVWAVRSMVRITVEFERKVEP